MIDTALVALVAVGFSAMILAGGPITLLLLATGFVFVQVAFHLAGSLNAMNYYCIGDKETARRYANLDLKDGFLEAGRAIGLEEDSGIIYDGCNLAANIILLYAPATMLKNGIKNKVSKLLSGSADEAIVGGADFYVAPNGKALPGQYKEWLGTNMRESLINSVDDPTLKKAIGEVYRPGSIIGDGGTTYIIRFEQETGILLSKSGHIQKAVDMSKYFQKLVDSGTLSPEDTKVAQDIINRFNAALGGK